MKIIYLLNPEYNIFISDGIKKLTTEVVSYQVVLPQKVSDGRCFSTSGILLNSGYKPGRFIVHVFEAIKPLLFCSMAKSMAESGNEWLYIQGISIIFHLTKFFRDYYISVKINDQNTQ